MRDYGLLSILPTNIIYERYSKGPVNAFAVQPLRTLTLLTTVIITSHNLNTSPRSAAMPPSESYYQCGHCEKHIAHTHTDPPPMTECIYCLPEGQSLQRCGGCRKRQYCVCLQHFPCMILACLNSPISRRNARNPIGVGISPRVKKTPNYTTLCNIKI